VGTLPPWQTVEVLVVSELLADSDANLGTNNCARSDNESGVSNVGS
jgi:hypothetical protein